MDYPGSIHTTYQDACSLSPICFTTDTDTYPQAYSYQVNLYIEIDQAFIDNHGSFEDALDYINILVAGASAIFESEIDTHLHVSHVHKTNRYDAASSTSEALEIMRDAFAGSTWHDGNINLHHALLGHRLGGGIAYVGALCNPNFGFGLSANLEGNFESLDASALWDLTVFAHELGEPPKLFPCRSSDDLQGKSFGLSII